MAVAWYINKYVGNQACIILDCNLGCDTSTYDNNKFFIEVDIISKMQTTFHFEKNCHYDLLGNVPMKNKKKKLQWQPWCVVYHFFARFIIFTCHNCLNNYTFNLLCKLTDAENLFFFCFCFS